MAFLFLVSDFSYGADDYDAEGNEEQKGPRRLGDHAVHRRVAHHVAAVQRPEPGRWGQHLPHPTRGTGTWGRYPCSSFQVGEEEVWGEEG